VITKEIVTKTDHSRGEFGSRGFCPTCSTASSAAVFPKRIKTNSSTPPPGPADLRARCSKLRDIGVRHSAGSGTSSAARCTGSRTAGFGRQKRKMERLYPCLAGTEFKQKIEGIVDAFPGMQEQINRERRAMGKQWKEREKQIERVVKNTVGLYGDMQGIIGGQIPEIPALELKQPDELLLETEDDS
jgi:hypothetical protein